MRWHECEDREQGKKEYEIAQEMVKANPSNAFGYYMLGTIYDSKGDFGEAYKCCQQAISIDPQAALFHIFMAYLHTQTNNHGERSAVDEIAVAFELLEEAKDINIFAKRKWYLTDTQQQSKLVMPYSREQMMAIQVELEYAFERFCGGLDPEIAKAKVAALRKEGKAPVADKLENLVVKSKEAWVKLPNFNIGGECYVNN